MRTSLRKFFVYPPGRQPYLISPILGLNPLGGLPSESVQFGFLCRIVVAATWPFMIEYLNLARKNLPELQGIKRTDVALYFKRLITQQIR